MIEVRRYGTSGPCVIVLHGGPGMAGEMAPLGRALADSFVVLEPLQRPAGGAPLTVGGHVEDLDEVVRTLGAAARPQLVGSSWGAMLGLAYAAAHADAVASVVAIGSGTFDPVARARMNAILAERAQLEFHAKYTFDGEERREEGAGEDGALPFDRQANRETWDDMLRLQAAGVYPAAFAKICAPVLMLHGAYDPHPGAMIRDSLAPFVRDLEYVEWQRCGHYPWRERHARTAFYATLRAWLAEHAKS